MPDTITELCEAIDKLESRSSILTRVKADIRKQIVEALINRHPPTLREVFDFFALDHHGVSYTAFYYWARKIKRFAALFEMNRTLDDKEDPAGLLPRILASRVLDNVLDDQVDPIVLRRMMQTYRMASSIEMAKKRLHMEVEDVAARRELEKVAGSKDVARLALLIARTQQSMDEYEKPPAPAPEPQISNPSGR